MSKRFTEAEMPPLAGTSEVSPARGGHLCPHFRSRSPTGMPMLTNQPTKEKSYDETTETATPPRSEKASAPPNDSGLSSASYPGSYGRRPATDRRTMTAKRNRTHRDATSLSSSQEPRCSRCFPVT